VHSAVLPAVTPDKATDFFGLNTGATTGASVVFAAGFATTFFLLTMMDSLQNYLALPWANKVSMLLSNAW
jgi:hypothetical protein